MSNNAKLTAGLFGAAIVCAVLVAVISSATVVPLVAKGSGPEGVQVTSSGWVSLVLSILGAGGFSLAGIVSAIITVVTNHLGVAVKPNATEVATEAIELTAAFAGLMADRTNRAAQRRFFFALSDAVDVVPHCTSEIIDGVIVFRYSGLVETLDPPAA